MSKYILNERIRADLEGTFVLGDIITFETKYKWWQKLLIKLHLKKPRTVNQYMVTGTSE